MLWGFFLIAGSSCTGGGKYGPLGATCPQLVSGDPLQAQFSANARANAKIRTFVAASKSLVEASVQMEALATEACRNMGRDLGVPDQEMQARDDEAGASAKSACGALSAKIDSILSGYPGACASHSPQCQANFEAKARCEGSCDVQIDRAGSSRSASPRSSAVTVRTLRRALRGTCQGQ
jgi:hypothetical protein